MRTSCFAMVPLALTCVCHSVAQSRGQDAKSLGKEIARLKAIEAEQAKSYQMLKTGSIVIVQISYDRAGVPVRTSDIRQEFLTARIVAEAAKTDPDFAAAEQRADEAANRLIASCRDESRAKLRSLSDEMSIIRTRRQRAERALKALQHPNSPGVRPDFGGTWTSNWGKMVLNQTGTRVTGTYEHRTGKLAGTIGADGELRFQWTQSNGHGIGVFRLNSGGKTLSGTWNYTDDNGTVGTGGTWSGTRK